MIAEVILYKGKPSFKPVIVENDGLVNGLTSTHLLRLDDEKEESLLHRGDRWQVQVISAFPLKGADHKYRVDSKDRPMVVLKVKLEGKIRSFFSRFEWVTVIGEGKDEKEISREPAVRGEFTDMSTGRPVPTEQILVDGVIVRRRVLRELPKRSFYLYKTREWVTVEDWAGEEKEVSRVPAVMEEMVYLSGPAEVSVVERIFVTTATETKVVREKIKRKDNLSAWQDWLKETFAEEDLTADTSDVTPPELPKHLQR